MRCCMRRGGPLHSPAKVCLGCLLSLCSRSFSSVLLHMKLCKAAMWEGVGVGVGRALNAVVAALNLPTWKCLHRQQVEHTPGGRCCTRWSWLWRYPPAGSCRLRQGRARRACGLSPHEGRRPGGHAGSKGVHVVMRAGQERALWPTCQLLILLQLLGTRHCRLLAVACKRSRCAIGTVSTRQCRVSMRRQGLTHRVNEPPSRRGWPSKQGQAGRHQMCLRSLRREAGPKVQRRNRSGGGASGCAHRRPLCLAVL